MCTGIALLPVELPKLHLSDPRIVARFHDRDGRDEIQFHWWHADPILPVRLHGRIELLPWGCKSRRSRLPYGGWVQENHIEAGVLAGSNPEKVIIPANLGHDQGTWFLINEGIYGIVVQTGEGRTVYMLTTESSNYYGNMTQQNPLMPLLVNQVI